MKKKISLLIAALMLFAGVVSASSINGDYKGNPIVKIMSNGKQLETDEVPAVILDGHTVVPISTLRQLGASVTWDAYGYSVEVKMPNQQNITPPSNTNVDLEKVIIGFNEKAKEYNASNVRLVFNNLGGFISAGVNSSGDINIDTQNIMMTSSFVANSPVSQMFIEIYQNNSLTGYYQITRSNVESFIKKEMSVDDFIKSWKWNPSAANVQPTEKPQVPVSAVPTDRAIESTIDGDFTGWDGETIFKLSNGQIWQQSSFAYTYHYAYMPKVIIYNSDGDYKMKVDGVDDAISVKRIK